MRTAREIRTLLVPVDGSASGARALQIAAGMAKAFGGRLTLLHVDPMRELPVLMSEATDPREDDKAQAILSDALRQARAFGVEPRVERRRGRTADQILRYITAERPDLVVMGTRGLSRAKGLLMGSVSQAVTRRARAEVILVR